MPGSSVVCLLFNFKYTIVFLARNWIGSVFYMKRSLYVHVHVYKVKPDSICVTEPVVWRNRRLRLWRRRVAQSDRDTRSKKARCWRADRFWRNLHSVIGLYQIGNDKQNISNRHTSIYVVFRCLFRDCMVTLLKKM